MWSLELSQVQRRLNPQERFGETAKSARVFFITRLSDFRAHRSPASDHDDRAVAIVADAIKGLQYGAIERFWRYRQNTK